jgi:hypothetical protein
MDISSSYSRSTSTAQRKKGFTKYFSNHANHNKKKLLHPDSRVDVSNAPIAWIIEVSKQSKAEPSF